MLHAAPLGRALPPPPVIGASWDQRTDDDAGCVSRHPTPRPPAAVKQLVGRVLTPTVLAKYGAVWAAVSILLWMIGTALALVLTALVPEWGSTPIVVLGFAGLGGGLAAGCRFVHRRRSEARTLAREGQLVTGIATWCRGQDSFRGELGDVLAGAVGETRYCIKLSIGFIRHEVWVALPSPPPDGAQHDVLVQPGVRLALVLDRFGRAHVGELKRV